MRQSPLLVALTASALLVAGCGIDDPYQGSTPPASTPAVTQTTPAPETSSAPTATSADAREVEPDLSPARATARRDALLVARRFLAGYLPYSYGRRRAGAIGGATAQLRRELASSPPRVSRGLSRGARPRVRRLRATGVGADRVFVFAQIAERRSSYATSLTILRRHRRWLVSEVR